MWPILYTAELDYPLSDIDEFNQWFAFRHAPDLFRAGFQSCTCYRAVEGGMALIDVYEAASWEIFKAPRYREMGGRDPYCPPILEKRIDKTHTVYEQRLIMPDATAENAPGFDADWISFVRYAAPTQENEIVDWLHREESARLLGLGARRVRLAQRTQDHPVYPTRRPAGFLLTEWSQRPPPQAALREQLKRAFGNALSQVDAFVGYRLYPWTDKPLPGPDR